MMRLRRDEAVGPTALYTGHVWSRHGLSHPALGTVGGRVLFEALRPAMTLSALVGGPTFEGMLVARHRVIDELLEAAIADGHVGVVVEIACGMSPRGWRFARRHGDSLEYVEAELPEMADRKRRALAGAGTLGAGHRVEVLDATARDGARSLAGVLGTLERSRGVAVVAEGLLNYLGEDEVRDLWARLAAELRAFPDGMLLCDLAVGGALPGPLARVATLGLSAFVQGRVGVHFAGAAAAEQALRDAGFARAIAHRPAEHPAAGDRRGDPGAKLVRVMEGWVGA